MHIIIQFIIFQNTKYQDTQNKHSMLPLTRREDTRIKKVIRYGPKQNAVAVSGQ